MLENEQEVSDDFAWRALPDKSLCPVFEHDMYPYPNQINVGEELTDKVVAQGLGQKVAVIGCGGEITYQQLSEYSNQIARTLTEDYDVIPGSRILIKSRNSPMMIACWLGILKAGAIAFNTLSMTRAMELAPLIDAAKVNLILCEDVLMCDLDILPKKVAEKVRVVNISGNISGAAELNQKIASKPKNFNVVQTSQYDIALLASTSGTTGVPKITMHTHRDLLTIADGFGKAVLRMDSSDVCVGTPPLAFTFGLGGLAVFPLRVGATTILQEVSPISLHTYIEYYHATVCFTAPTAYRVMLSNADGHQMLKKLRCAVSAGEHLPTPVWTDWKQKIGVPMVNAIGSTEALHAFASTTLSDSENDIQGMSPVCGYRLKLFNDKMQEVQIGEPGWLGFIGPTGCRYLSDPRQKEYVKDGWNITGDIFEMRDDGLYYFVSRADDMIISAGYNIAAPEVEAALLQHNDIKECAVVSAPDEHRGKIVRAHVVLADGVDGDEYKVTDIQDHVKKVISPYKYPRSIIFESALPKTPTGKIKRFELRG